MKINAPIRKFNNPIPEEKLNRILQMIDVHSMDSILDIGGGNGEVLARLLSRGNVKGILIDNNEKVLQECRKKQSHLIHEGSLEVIHSDAKAYLKTLSPSTLDCVLCIGSSYALGSYINFVITIRPYLKPNGLLLMGEEYWLKKPDSEYLSDLLYHHQQIEEVEKLGLTFLFANTASEDDWNLWEGQYFLEAELEYAQNKNEDDLQKLEETRTFRRAQIKYGRKTMGFGLYLFSK